MAAAVCAALAGCGEERSDDTGGAPAAEADPADAVKSKVEFISPADGSTVDGKFTAKVKLTDFEIDPGAIGKSPQPGRGHLHFQLDGGRFDIPQHSGENGKMAKSLGVDGKYSPAGAPEITYSDIPPGTHVLKVLLANNNHTDTGVQAESQITVRR